MLKAGPVYLSVVAIDGVYTGMGRIVVWAKYVQSKRKGREKAFGKKEAAQDDHQHQCDIIARSCRSVEADAVPCPWDAFSSVVVKSAGASLG